MNCLFCGSVKIENASYPRPTVFNNKQFGYKHCKNCGLVFINPLPAADDYGMMYSASYHDEFYFNETAPDYINWYQLLEKYGNGKKILDFGCGDASFLKFFHQRNYQCTGVEYDPALVDRLRKENPAIQFYTVDEFWKQEEQYNVIFMGDVLEHISTPAAFLNRLMDKLKAGGLIAAQGPLENNRNLALRFRKLTSGIKTTLSKSPIASHVPYHISFSNAKNQKAVFERAGLEPNFMRCLKQPGLFHQDFHLRRRKVLSIL
jgi:SAM-dependent methyltransferase